MTADAAGPIRTTAAELGGLLAGLCADHRIDLAGAVALPCPLPLADRYLDWLQAGKHAGLEYLARDPEARLDPTLRNPEASTLLVFAQGYTRGWPAGDADPSAGGPPDEPIPWIDRVARYARGRDYHEVFLGDIRMVLAGLRRVWPALTAYASTDTGPYLEREYAWLAGLGFLGRNTCLIHERLGSGLFLGVALTDLQVDGLAEPGAPAVRPLFGVSPRRVQPPTEAYLSACGSCTRCIDACPTAALDPDGGLDARSCLSTWTIELKGEAPGGRESEQGGILFGCDICQAVCPWNQRAFSRPAPPVPREYAALPEHDDLELEDLATIGDEEFRARFRRTPLWRSHPAGMRRNARRVLANLAGSPEEEERP
ncbi:MAG: epoxyqueuosine reductase [Candidatus Krumholzibacteriia bacterium]